jgi:hypothetical protein
MALWFPQESRACGNMKLLGRDLSSPRYVDDSAIGVFVYDHENAVKSWLPCPSSLGEN